MINTILLALILAVLVGIFYRLTAILGEIAISNSWLELYNAD